MTGLDILESALDLCGLRETDGCIPDAMDDLVQRSVSLLNILMAKYEHLNSRVTGTTFNIKQITGLSSQVGMHGMIEQCILPFSLAALLIQDEDAALAVKFESAAKDAVYILDALPVTVHKEIAEVY